MEEHTTIISVIIPTYNGANRITKTLDAILNQSVPPDEIIVVIDGSTDDTGQVVEHYGSKFENLKIIVQANMGRAGVRNTGAKNASGDLLIFYDDDTRPEPDSVLRHREFHRKHPNSICGGFPLEDEQLMKTDIQKYKLWLSKKWTAKYENGLNRLTDKNLFLTAANMSIPKTVFDSLGGFNEKLTDAEDYELAVRAQEKGIPIYFDKSNIAWHDDFIKCSGYIGRQKEYAKVQESLNKMVGVSKHRRPYLPNPMKKTIYRLLGNKYFVNLIDRGYLRYLPKKIRYLLYDIVITGAAKFDSSSTYK